MHAARAHTATIFALVAACGAILGATAPVHGAPAHLDRLAAQEAIERHYHDYRADAAPFEQAVPPALLAEKVRRFLALSDLLQRRWGFAITDAMLQREMERIAASTHRPQRLRELYAALGDDGVVIKEALIRPLLAERHARALFERDGEIHREARERAAALRAAFASGGADPGLERPGRTLLELIRLEDGAAAVTPPKLSDVLERLPEAGRSVGFPLRLTPPAYARERSRAPATLGMPSPLADEGEAFVFRVALADSGDRATIAEFRFPKLRWDAFFGTERERYDGAGIGIAADPASEPVYPRPRHGGVESLVDSSCTPDDLWTPTSTLHDPTARFGHTAVWTGSEMIVWGGNSAGLLLGSGDRYDPVTDSWASVSTLGAPGARSGHTAVWTGSEMIVWGGRGAGAVPENTGARYDPAGDSWTGVSTLAAPEARRTHTAVWTGGEMVVFGGRDGSDFSLATGGRYDPVTDGWTALPFSSGGARHDHTAVWTGSEMVVWGGVRRSAAGTINLGTGAVWDAARDRWRDVSTNNSPTARERHTAVWTGTRMIVFGGIDGGAIHGDGGSYNPQNNKWTGISTTGGPTERFDHAAVWTGSEMVVWGGQEPLNTATATGGRYDPVADSWAPTAMAGAPIPAVGPEPVWTGSEMIVWGGRDTFQFETNSGGRYDPVTDSWTPTPITSDAPSGRRFHVADWTGSEMILWGGDSYPNTFDTGSRYDPTLDVWRPTTTTGAPQARTQHMGAWAGGRFVVWGGFIVPDADDSGGRYDPVSDSWQPTTLTDAPFPRFDSLAVSTGDEMIVWGGDTDLQFPGELNSGAVYDPALDGWTTMPLSGAPSPRTEFTAVWTGTDMIVWGGTVEAGNPDPQYNDGARYRPVGNNWLPMVTTFPDLTPLPGRKAHSAVWTGNEMIVWGGDIHEALGRGEAYDAQLDRWRSISEVGAPVGRTDHRAVWTGSLMLVWGGLRNQVPVYDSDGGRYDPVRDAWTASAQPNAPEPRITHTAVWTGNEAVIWGGIAGSTFFDTGGAYDPADLDLDGISDACDCAPGDPSASGLPGEIAGVAFGDVDTLVWQSGNPAFGVGTTHDVLRGPMAELPVGSSAAEQCLADGTSSASLTVADVPATGTAFWYLVRAGNICGTGTYGSGAVGERVSTGCP